MDVREKNFIPKKSDVPVIPSDYQSLKALYLKELSDRQQAEELLLRQNESLSVLNRFSIDLSMLASEASLEDLIVKRLKEISGARFVMFSNYDPDKRIVSTEHAEMEPGLLRSLIKLAGKGKKLEFEMNDEMYQHVTKEVVGIRKSFHEVSFGAIPRPVGAALEALLNVDRFIGIAYLIEGKLYGTSLLGMTRGRPNPPTQLLESFAFLAAVSLRRKQAEVALQHSFDMLNKLTLQVPGVVYQYRLWPDGHSAFPFASPGMFDIYGVTPDEVREDASAVFTRIHPDDYDMIVETINESAKRQIVYHSEFRVILPDQGVRWRMCNARPTKLDDGSTLWYGVISDITERKLVEKELIQAKEQAEEAGRLKSAFLANISHEIRTPMNGILGFAELLKEPDLTGEEQKEYIRIIEKSGDRMLNIINDIVDISKIESGQMKVLITETNINEQIDFIYEFFKPEVERKGMQISSVKPLDGGDAIIRTDREKVYAILTNFVKNAIKYTNHGSIEVGYAKKDHFLEFYVKDTGPGIPYDRQSAIFERFVQVDLTDKRAIQGAGLGLSISKAYVEMLGGKIWVVSEPGHGSVFYFTVPVHSAQ